MSISKPIKKSISNLNKILKRDNNLIAASIDDILNVTNAISLKRGEHQIIYLEAEKERDNRMKQYQQNLRDEAETRRLEKVPLESLDLNDLNRVINSTFVSEHRKILAQNRLDKLVEVIGKATIEPTPEELALDATKKQAIANKMALKKANTAAADAVEKKNTLRMLRKIHAIKIVQQNSNERKNFHIVKAANYSPLGVISPYNKYHLGDRSNMSERARILKILNSPNATVANVEKYIKKKSRKTKKAKQTGIYYDTCLGSGSSTAAWINDIIQHSKSPDWAHIIYNLLIKCRDARQLDSNKYPIPDQSHLNIIEAYNHIAEVWDRYFMSKDPALLEDIRYTIVFKYKQIPNTPDHSFIITSTDPNARQLWGITPDATILPDSKLNIDEISDIDTDITSALFLEPDVKFKGKGHYKKTVNHYRYNKKYKNRKRFTKKNIKKTILCNNNIV